MNKNMFYNYWCHFMYMYSCISHLFKNEIMTKKKTKSTLLQRTTSAHYTLSQA